MNIINTTSSKTITTEVDIVFCNATSGAITITLPAVADAVNHEFIIKKTDNSANAVTVSASAIEGSTSFGLQAQFEAVKVVSNGLSYYLSSERDTSLLAAHLADTTDAHDASAISVADAGEVFTATDVEGVLAELEARIAAIEP